MSTQFPPTITTRELNRATLARQHLLQRARADLPTVIEDLIGLQAQAPFPPYTGLWSRVEAFDPHRLGQLLQDRTVVRMALMRGTVHLVTADDALAIRPLVQPILDRWLATAVTRRLPGLDLTSVAAQAAARLDDSPMTPAELGSALALEWPGADPGGLADAARGALPLVQLPPRAVWGQTGRTVLATASTWLGRELDSAPDIERLVRRYLAAFGPASVADVQRWSGLTGLRPVIDRLRPHLIEFRAEDGRALFDLPDRPRPAASTAAAVRFLPGFDNLLLSYADGSRILDPAWRRTVFTANGIIHATVLVDGFVAGTWTVTQTRTTAILTVTALHPLPVRTRRAIEVEGAALLAFTTPGQEAEIRLTES